MRKRKLRLALAILLLAVLGGLAWLVLSSHGAPEPVYEHRRLSEWLSLGASGLDHGEGEDAVRAIGTNAMPTLLRMLRARDSKLKLMLIDLAKKQHLVRVNFIPAAELNEEAMWGFSCLGAAASNAVPALSRVFESRLSEVAQIGAADALVRIGPTAIAAVPALLRTAANTNAKARVRGAVVLSLGEIHAETEPVLSTLIKCLKDSQPIVRERAAGALGILGIYAKPAVPALIESMDDTDFQVCANAAVALSEIDPEALAKLGREHKLPF